jgi:glycosyltransferase involved in cell wall biosynthesis
MRVQFVIGNVVDYQVPRYRALAKLASSRGYDVSLVEIYGRSGTYGYPQSNRGKFFEEGAYESVTLFKNSTEGGPHWLLVVARLRAVIRATRPDIVITMGYNTNYSIYLCLARTVARRFKIVYMSDSKADDGKRNWLKEALKKLLVSRFDGALVAGEKHRQYAQSLGIPLHRSRIGFDVIDVDYFSEAARRALARAAYERVRFGVPHRYVLCVSRFVERKNVMVVVEAFARSTLPKQGISLVLVGQGPLEQAIRNKISELDLRERVIILHEVLNRDMPALYALTDFVVLASAFDQWGLCVNEAMAAGRPAIVSVTCGCANELVHDGYNGFIVQPGHVDELAERMTRLGEDETLRAKFSANAASMIRNWTPKLFAENALALANAVQGTP